MAWVVGIGIAILLFVLFPKQMGAILMVAALIVGGVVLYYYQQGREQERERSLVSMSVRVDPQACSEKFPVLIVFANRHTTKTLEYVAFALEGFRPGYSSAVRSRNSYRSDRIIPPGGRYSACWAAPDPRYGSKAGEALADLNWIARPMSVRWRD